MGDWYALDENVLLPTCALRRADDMDAFWRDLPPMQAALHAAARAAARSGALPAANAEPYLISVTHAEVRRALMWHGKGGGQASGGVVYLRRLIAGIDLADPAAKNFCDVAPGGRRDADSAAWLARLRDEELPGAAGVPG